MKKSPLRRKSKSDLRKLEDAIWKECKRIVREQFGNKDGTVDCYTCPARNLVGANCQLGHVPWPKATLGAYLKYDIRCLRYQCFSCNIHRGGMGAEAYKRMLREEGKAYMEKLEQDRLITVKSSDFYPSLYKEYILLKR